MQRQSGGGKLDVYDELYAAWRFEIENPELGGLSSDFYARAADYLRSINEENHLIDKKTVKSTLLARELGRVKCMLQELIWARYKKLVALVSESQKPPSGLLAKEEDSLCTSFLSFAISYQKFADKLLQGQISTPVSSPVTSQASKAAAKKVSKRVVLRFVKPVPAVVGVDMKTYGPFMVEDVASVPVENAGILVKQGLAEKIELS
jgi:DNA replication initiation complex subunit (GINS family)